MSCPSGFAPVRPPRAPVKAETGSTAGAAGAGDAGAGATGSVAAPEGAEIGAATGAGAEGTAVANALAMALGAPAAGDPRALGPAASALGTEAAASDALRAREPVLIDGARQFELLVVRGWKRRTRLPDASGGRSPRAGSHRGRTRLQGSEKLGEFIVNVGGTDQITKDERVGCDDNGSVGRHAYERSWS